MLKVSYADSFMIR